MSLFERYLSLWVALCIVAGVALGHLLPGLFAAIAERGNRAGQSAGGRAGLADDHPDAAEDRLRRARPGARALARRRCHAVHQLGGKAVLDGVAGLAVHRPSVRAMAAIARQIPSYIAGLILLAAAPCTAMVFVWSNLCEGEPHYTLSQVALNDVIMVFAFAPLVGLLLGVASIAVPWATLLISVVLYIVVPVIIAQAVAARALMVNRAGGAATDAASCCNRCRWLRC
jgi:ACR3 family arsenite transporter